MMLSSIVIACLICITVSGKRKDSYLDIRYPSIEGLVTMQPGTYDSNTCQNNTNNRYNGGGFYIQDKNGNGIFVCPDDPSLVSNVNYGDKVEIKGQTETDQYNILTIIANSVKVLKTNRAKNEKITIIDTDTFDKFNQDTNFGDLIQIEAFVTEVVADFGFGAILEIANCAGETIEGFWTGSIDADTTAAEVFDVANGPKYFRMIGFVENFYPYCFPSDDKKEFQPRDVNEIIEITAPCNPPSP